jgi:uncharacterized protein YdaU (DUF1376 family)
MKDGLKPTFIPAPPESLPALTLIIPAPSPGVDGIRLGQNVPNDGSVVSVQSAHVDTRPLSDTEWAKLGAGTGHEDSHISSIDVARFRGLSPKDQRRVSNETLEAVKKANLPDASTVVDKLIGEDRLGTCRGMIVGRTYRAEQPERIQADANNHAGILDRWAPLAVALHEIFSPDGEEAKIRRLRREAANDEAYQRWSIAKANWDERERQRELDTKKANLELLLKAPVARAVLSHAMNTNSDELKALARLIFEAETRPNFVSSPTEEICNLLGLEIYQKQKFEG